MDEQKKIYIHPHKSAHDFQFVYTQNVRTWCIVDVALVKPNKSMEIDRETRVGFIYLVLKKRTQNTKKNRFMQSKNRPLPTKVQVGTY